MCGPRSRHSRGKLDDQTSGGIAWMSRWSSAEISTCSAGRDMGPLLWGDSRRARLRAGPEAHGKVVQAANDEALDVGECARVHQAHVVQPREEPFEADARLGARETGTDAEMLAVTKGDIAPGVRTPCIEAVGVFEDAGAAFGSTDHRHRDGPCRDDDAGEPRIV